MAEEKKQSAAAPEKAKESGEKKSKLNENMIEIIVAILLGITALLTAWASWIGSLHGGNMSTNYTKSNNIAADGNAAYSAGMQLYLSDLMAWNTMMDYSFDKEVAAAEGNTTECELIDAKLQTYAEQNLSEILLEAVNNMSDDMESPFEVEGTYEKYFEEANALLNESQELLEEGKDDNAHGDAYSLVNVIYSLVLFLLGIVGIFKRLPNRAAVLCIAAVGLVVTTIYMLTIPMPTDFSFTGYFK